MSQFWYDRATAETIARETLEAHQVAFISGTKQTPHYYQLCQLTELGERQYLAPSAFVAYRRLGGTRGILFEFDQRFSVYGMDFVSYDYNDPLNLVSSHLLEKECDFIVVDPPFLSNECWVYEEFIRLLYYFATCYIIFNSTFYCLDENMSNHQAFSCSKCAYFGLHWRRHEGPCVQATRLQGNIVQAKT